MYCHDTMWYLNAFTTVPYLRAGEIPPHWKDLVANLSESVTNEKFELANIWAATEGEGNDSGNTDNMSLFMSRSLDLVIKDEIKGSLGPEGGDECSSLEPAVSEGAKPPPDSSLIMPKMTNLDAITLRRSL